LEADDVYIWRYALLVVHARKEEDALADGNYRTQITEKTLEFPMVLPAPSP